MNDSAVSVIIPAFNAEAYITEALTSILTQTRPLSEIIVIDDGSTDATAERVRAFGHNVILLQQSNQGIYGTLNRGIQHAQGEWLAFLDADDLWTPQRLEKQFAAFQSDATLHCVYGHIQNFYSPETDTAYRTRVVCPPEPLEGLWYHTLLMRRADFLRVGSFGTTWAVGSFMEWFARAQSMGIRYAMLPDIVLLRRLHPNNMGLRERASQQDYARILKLLLERKRAASKLHV